MALQPLATGGRTVATQARPPCGRRLRDVRPEHQRLPPTSRARNWASIDVTRCAWARYWAGHRLHLLGYRPYDWAPPAKGGAIAWDVRAGRPSALTWPTIAVTSA